MVKNKKFQPKAKEEKKGKFEVKQERLLVFRCFLVIVVSLPKVGTGIEKFKQKAEEENKGKS